MAFLTIADATAHFDRVFGRQAPVTAALTRTAPRPLTHEFDVFLSHSSVDKRAVLGLREYLKLHGLDAYVDWLDDPQLDRSKVTIATADRLRTRMRRCKSLFFATSEASPSSKWMPWELGYFDGFRGGRVAVVPLLPTASASFAGQEYIGLYPVLDVVALAGGTRHPRIKDNRGPGSKDLRSFANGTGAFT